MAFQSADNCAEADVIFLCNSQRMSMTFHFFQSGGYSQTTLDELSALMDDWAGTFFIPLLSSQASYVQTDVRGLELINDLTSTDLTNTGVGGDGSAPNPNLLCFAVTRRSNFTGRSARGRVYFPTNVGMISSTEDFIVGASATAIVDALNEIKPAALAESWVHVILSRFTNGAKRATALPFGVVDYLFSDLEFDTQRRRMPNK